MNIKNIIYKISDFTGGCLTVKN